MAETVENPMREPLKRFQALLARMDRRIGELSIGQTETHTAVLALRHDQATDADVVAHVQVRVDGPSKRLDRVERRLDRAE